MGGELGGFCRLVGVWFLPFVFCELVGVWFLLFVFCELVYVCVFTVGFLVFARQAFLFQSMKRKQKSCSIIRSFRKANATPPVIEHCQRFFFGSDLNHTITIFVFLFPFKNAIGR